MISLPARGVDEDFDSGSDINERRMELNKLLWSVHVAHEGVSDVGGSGVVAVRDLRPGEILLDPTVVCELPSILHACHARWRLQWRS